MIHALNFTMCVSTAPHDYPGVVQTVVFAPGETQQLVPVLTVTDRVVEGVEQFTALLTNQSPRVILEGSMATIHITDNGRKCSDWLRQ